eukprot:6259885-Amphidinium_carterae.1
MLAPVGVRTAKSCGTSGGGPGNRQESQGCLASNERTWAPVWWFGTFIYFCTISSSTFHHKPNVISWKSPRILTKLSSYSLNVRLFGLGVLCLTFIDASKNERIRYVLLTLSISIAVLYVRIC